jgi:hypothetical protein
VRCLLPKVFRTVGTPLSTFCHPLQVKLRMSAAFEKKTIPWSAVFVVGMGILSLMSHYYFNNIIQPAVRPACIYASPQSLPRVGLGPCALRPRGCERRGVGVLVVAVVQPRPAHAGGVQAGPLRPARRWRAHAPHVHAGQDAGGDAGEIHRGKRPCPGHLGCKEASCAVQCRIGCEATENGFGWRHQLTPPFRDASLP